MAAGKPPVPGTASIPMTVLLSEGMIAAKVADLARAIDRDYAGRVPVLVGVLTGATIFMSDLVRQLQGPVEMEFMAVSSYGAGTESTGVVRILKDLNSQVTGRDLIIVEDIVDSGLTLAYLQNVLRAREPASLRTCVLLDKKERRETDVVLDYIGFTIPNAFVIGYGLDYAGLYRQLPFVGVLDPSAL
ncbi:MAG: hypoxanthine phosphoribosyltransferase [Thermomicrobia bacterium]|nr:hypoxanthine phosphoribosyltransferase [Thermomicrobia bacterium]